MKTFFYFLNMGKLTLEPLARNLQSASLKKGSKLF